VKSENTEDTYHGVLGLDNLPKELKALNWGMCFVIATGIALLGYFRVEVALPSSPIRTFLNWLSVISPICISVAWLRLTGERWQRALLLFIFVPVVFMCILFVLGLVAILFMDD
jgi:hypothetical protein